MITQTAQRPYRKLWGAVLLHAMLDLFDRRYKQKAEIWFNDRKNHSVNSFNHICSILGIDADRARKRILIMRSKAAINEVMNDHRHRQPAKVYEPPREPVNSAFAA